MSGAEPGIGLTVGRPELLRGGSDLAFRQMVSDLFTISARMQMVRDAVAERMGVSGPQSGILLAIWELQGDGGVGVKRIADHLHVSGAFVTAETGRLARAGIIEKRPNPADRRRVLLSLTATGRAALRNVVPELRRINDLFFGSLDGADFDALRTLAGKLVGSSATGVGALDPALRNLRAG